MAVNYPYYNPQQPTPTPMFTPNPYVPSTRPAYTEQPQIGIKGRPVSSIEEVRATSIDFDGSIFVFPDIANKRIYTKQINLDGTSTLNVYELKNMPVETVTNPSQYVTREEFESVLKQLRASIMAPPMQPVAPIQPMPQYQQEPAKQAEPEEEPQQKFEF